MRSLLPFAAMFFSLMFVGVVYSQNDLPPANQPGGQGPGGQAPGGPGGAPPAQPGAPDDALYHSQVSYALGRNFAMNIKENKIDCELNSLLAGISDVLTGAQPKWSEQQLDTVLQRFGREMQQREMSKTQQQAAKNQQEATAFLTQNATKEGVQTTPSGLQYRILRPGTGPSPTLNDTVKCNYKGTLLNGTEFDSSTRQGGPAEFPVRRVIPGWTEALQKMHVGEKWQLFVPAKLAYDMSPPPGSPIEAGSLLVFEIELLDVAKK